jgi:hypothetical protein
MKPLALAAAIVLMLATSGCMTHQTPIDSTKARTGTIAQTRSIEI